jgi:DnaJ-class molecular chaperone
MPLAGQLSADENFIHQDYKKPAGRPSKKRKERPYLQKTSVSRICTACGGSGQMYTTCTAPSMQYRYERHNKAKALEWCRTRERLEAAD